MTFGQWFDEKWKANRGLITPTTAAKLLELSLSRIYRLRKEGKIRYFIYDGDKTLYMSRSDVEKLRKIYELKRRARKQMSGMKK